MTDALAQSRPPEADGRQRNRPQIYYPQARVTLQVVFENFGDPEAPKAFPVTPREVLIHGNSFREADTWSVTFDAQDLPFTPDAIRAGAAEIYLFNTDGIGQLPEVIRAKDDPDTARLEGLEPSIVGLFDDASLSMSDDGRMVTLSGMDYTQLFTAKQWDPATSGQKGRVPSGKSLLNVLLELKNEVTSAEVMSLDPRGTGAAVIVGTDEGKTNKKGLPVAAGKSYWDVMYETALRYGHVIYVEGLKIAVVELEQFMRERAANIRKMAWGRNISALRMSRALGKEQVPIIECVSYDDKRRKNIKARFPSNPKQLRQTRVTGLGAKSEEVRVIPVRGVRSQRRLEDIAKQYYYSLARSETKVEIQTKDLRDLEGNDLIEMRAGDSLGIRFDAFNADSVVLEGMSVAQRIEHLKGLGYDPEVATTIAASLERVNIFKHPFRVREVTLEWRHDSGLDISVELQNYVNTSGQEA